jgi:hypothetical protein
MSRKAVLIVLCPLALALAPAAQAAPPITNTADSGPGSLRQAIADAAPGETVNVPPGTYTLSSGQLVVDKALTVAGSGARSTIVSGGGASRVFQTAGTTVTLSGMTVTGGKADITSLVDCQGGGGICNSGALVLDGVAVVNNVANVAINNQNAMGGGGVYNNGDAVTVTNSTISGNQANVTSSGTPIGASGGGGYFDNGDGPTITNSTVSNNSATINGAGARHGGGGIYLNGAAMTATHLTLADNSVGGNASPSGGNFYVDNSTASTMKNSIVSGGGATNCDKFGTNLLTSQGGNVESADTCGFTAAGDKRGVDPALAALANNGGQTDTRALSAGSPAIDAAVGCPPPATDQRGIARPQGGGCDSGAFELAPTVAGPTPPGGPAPRVLPKSSCLSVPNVTRDRLAPLRGGTKLVLATRQVDDPLKPLRLTLSVRGRGAIASATFTVNGKAVPAASGGRRSTIPVGVLRIGSRRNKVVAAVVLRDGRKAKVTQFLVILRCHVPKLACKRLSGGRRLRCVTRTPLAVRRVRVSASGPGNETARGTASVKRGRYTVTLTSRVALPAGVYIYKHVGTTKRRGERFFMVRLFTVR